MRARRSVDVKRSAPGMRPRLCFVGPMLGRNPGYVPSMGETLAALLARAGYAVVATSRHVNRGVRFLDMMATILVRGWSTDIQVLQVYAGRSFAVEDAASCLARCFGQRVVMHLHGGAMPAYAARHPAWARRVLRRASVLVCPSSYLARTMGGFGRRTCIIPNCIDLAAYRFRPRHRLAPRFLWMRAFHPIYNPLMALRVLARVRGRYPRAQLVMAGQDKGMEAEVGRLAGELGISAAVRFAGFVDMADKVRLMSDADIFLNTTHIDNTPVTVLEACAMGLPVVSTNVGGIPDLLADGETGLLVPDDSVEGMTAAALRLLAIPALATRLSSSGRQLAEKCDVRHVLPMWERLLAGVRGEGGR